MLETVGLSAEYLTRFPHALSGGQRQRIAIARAIAVDPKMIVCDEVLSALDVTTQEQLMALLAGLQDSRGMAYFFISHNMDAVRRISDRVAVMYLGHLVELSETEALYTNPLHPYTQALISAIPIPDPILERKRSRIILKGDLPSPVNPPSGCVFHPRCPFATPLCQTVKPVLKEFGPGRFVACHFPL